MDGEEEDIPRSLKDPSERIHFGSLEEQERVRLDKLRLLIAEKEDKGTDVKASPFIEGIGEGSLVFEGGHAAGIAVKERNRERDEETEEDVADEIEEKKLEGMEAAIAAGNIQSVGPDAETYELSAESKKQKELQDQKYQELLLKRRARALAVPTNDNAVRSKLRALEEPVTLFGEREMERRDRLRQIMAKMDANGELEKLMKEVQEGTEEEQEEQQMLKAELFYTEGSAELMHARGEIAQFSLLRAYERTQVAKRKREAADEDEDEETEAVLKSVALTTLQCSEIGDVRPVSGCAFSPDSSLLMTCSWSGLGKVWNVPNISNKTVLKGHAERVTAVAFHPRACIDQDMTAGNFATASADRKAILWSGVGKQLHSFEGHLDRLARLAFHPSGNYLGTASYDKTWRLWDINTGIELLLQEGHSRSVYGIAFQCDGSIAASCGLDALARVWDLRTGRSILALEGHVKSVLGVDFSPDGYHLATAGEDHTCRIWDLRKKGCIYVIPAHSALVAHVKYEPRDGHFLVTASYDNSARIWSGKDFKAVKTLSGHEGKVMGVDVAADGEYIATVSYDRTIKLWATDLKSMDVDQ